VARSEEEEGCQFWAVQHPQDHVPGHHSHGRVSLGQPAAVGTCQPRLAPCTAAMALAKPASPRLGRRLLLRKMGLHPAQQRSKMAFFGGDGGLRVPACCTVLLPRLRRRHGMLGAVVPAGAGVPNPLTETPRALGRGPGSQGASHPSGTVLPAWLRCLPPVFHPLRGGGSALGALGYPWPGPGDGRGCGLLPPSPLPRDDAPPVPAKTPTWEAIWGLQPAWVGGERDWGSVWI